MATFSPTRLKAFWTCPQRYVFSLTPDAPEDDKPYFALGKAVHRYVELYIGHCWATKQDSDYGRAEELMEEIRADLDPSLWDEFDKMAWDYMHTHVFGAAPEVGGLESRWAIGRNHEPCDYEQEDALIRGRVDRWWVSDGRLLISDVKTNRLIQSRDTVESDLQLLCYAWMGWRIHREEIYEVRIQLEFVRYTDNGNPVVIHAVFPVERLEKMTAWIDRRALELGAITAGDMQPKCKVGDACAMYGGCPNLYECPAWADYAPPEIIESSDDAAKALAWAKWVKSEGSRIDRQVKAWVDMQGEVSGYGAETKISKSKRYDYDPEKAWAVYERHGRSGEDFAQAVKMNARAIPKKLKSEIQAECESIISTRVTAKTI